jgi:hypothetical protein
LYFRGQLISFAYYYNGFNMREYDEVGTKEEAVRAQLLLADSNVTCVPSVRMMILNTKCAQAYITKPQVLRKYLS